MSSNHGTPYILRRPTDPESDEWVSPEPAGQVISDAVAAASGLEPDDLEELSAYVDVPELAAVLNGDDQEMTFTVEGYGVVVTSSGSVDVRPE